ncbi:hypothetical protein V0288_12235 [Pannus brasiliensis CCIBt3594]|uniref:Uncharacterized protein n=1 Tax=Pannus brasiliensis CCIBt3594 TaxID=1427578 RepID=A0AAW9QUX3_9CHRO
MKGKTVSAYTDSETASRVAGIAKLEHRPPARIAGMALKWFVSLPPEAREALWQIEALGDEDDLAEVRREMTRTLLNVRYNIARRQVLAEMNVEGLGELETEDDSLAAAVNLTHDE